MDGREEWDKEEMVSGGRVTCGCAEREVALMVKGVRRDLAGRYSEEGGKLFSRKKITRRKEWRGEEEGEREGVSKRVRGLG